jgi:hypothetical protein
MTFWGRLRFSFLVFTDWLLGTRLVERELTHLQRQVQAYEAYASAILQQMQALNHMLHIVQVELCLLYLRQRYLLRSRTWLRFDPAEGAGEERSLDWLIDRLVKHDLATVRAEAVGEQAYVYHLRPDWASMVDLLSAWKDRLDPVTLSWLREMRSNENGEIRH